MGKAWETLKTRIADELLARRIDRWITGLIAVLLVTFGFLLGRWTSFTSRATPIVFQEAPGSQSSEASETELKALVAGNATEKPPPPASAEREEPVAPVAEAAAPPPASAPAASQETGAFVASANGAKYYYPDCAEVKRIKEENKIWFDSEQEAKDSGYEPSACVQKRQ